MGFVVFGNRFVCALYVGGSLVMHGRDIILSLGVEVCYLFHECDQVNELGRGYLYVSSYGYVVASNRVSSQA